MAKYNMLVCTCVKTHQVLTTDICAYTRLQVDDEGGDLLRTVCTRGLRALSFLFFVFFVGIGLRLEI